MNRNLLGSFLATAAIVITGCASAPESKTPLEIQSMQSREFESSLDVVFPSVISVFQDLGYTINSADRSTGFITAESAASSNAATRFWLGVTNVSQTRATAFIEPIRDTTRVRLNFVATSESSSAYGQRDRNDKPILDAHAYQNAFEMIENAVFIRSAN